jgi:GntR family transcriptional repressor for pyruvate dehydrogenase complex
MNGLLYEDIVKKIEKQIHNGDYCDGEKLPSQRELAIQYDVSRNVVREAIGSLREKGFIVVKPGKGVYVKKPDNTIVAETLKRVLQNNDSTSEDLLEVREELEVSITRKAVQKATPDNIEFLKGIYQRMEEKKHHINQFVEEDANFHMALAEATQNRIFLMFISSFYELTEKSLFALTRLTPYSTIEAQKHHLQLIRAIELKDEQLAVQTMKEHIDLLRKEVSLCKKKICYNGQKSGSNLRFHEGTP